MINRLTSLLNYSSKRFFQNRLKDLENELDDVDTRIAELQAEREKIVDQIEYVEDRLGL
jgi:septal ring factor EnvC (AmiA/AmiB activator)